MVQKTIRRTRIGNTLETTQPETISPPKTPPQPKFSWLSVVSGILGFLIFVVAVVLASSEVDVLIIGLVWAVWALFMLIHAFSVAKNPKHLPFVGIFGFLLFLVAGALALFEVPGVIFGPVGGVGVLFMLIYGFLVQH